MTPRALIPLALLALVGCRNDDDAKIDTGSTTPVDTGGASFDADGDGHDSLDAGGDDCDDGDPAVHPGAEETPYNGIDDDCDAGTSDDDLDGDGFSGMSEEDCDDADPAIHPGASETCNGVDDDCNGQVDDGAGDTWYLDADGDGHGDADTTATACQAPTGYTAEGDDCDDTTADAYPGAAEVCDETDNNCDGRVDEGVGSTFWADVDGDGWGDPAATAEACTVPTGYTDQAGDCALDDPAVHPAADELCDGVDNDCDGTTDEDDAVDAPTWYADGDGDAYGDPATGSAACTAPAGTVSNAEDCDDSDPALNPDTLWYPDADKDGFGDPDGATASCTAPTALYTADGNDCDDLDADAFPGNTELCDGTDNDCDGTIDEADAADAPTWYADADGDSYGDPSSGTAACTQPTGLLADATDCDDADAAVNPAASEVCDSIDNNCDGVTDENSAVDALTWYADGDNDGYGDPMSSMLACEQPSGYLADNSDCDDDDDAIHPNTAEACDGVDDDCDGVPDNGVLGFSSICPAESCAAILANDASVADGDYYLDPTGSGSATLYSCDMSTDGGGWTLAVGWDRTNDGDTQADFESLMTELKNNMGHWTEKTGYIQWYDNDATADVMAYQVPIDVPNDGETLLDLNFYGYSYEDSASFFSVVADGALEEIICAAYLDWNSSGLAVWSSTEQGYWPYTCSQTYSGQTASFTWADTYQTLHNAEVTAFDIRSFHYDSSGGDYSRLYWFALWVR